MLVDLFSLFGSSPARWLSWSHAQSLLLSIRQIVQPGQFSHNTTSHKVREILAPTLADLDEKSSVVVTESDTDDAGHCLTLLYEKPTRKKCSGVDHVTRQVWPASFNITRQSR